MVIRYMRTQSHMNELLTMKIYGRIISVDFVLVSIQTDFVLLPIVVRGRSRRRDVRLLSVRGDRPENTDRARPADPVARVAIPTGEAMVEAPKDAPPLNWK